VNPALALEVSDVAKSYGSLAVLTSVSLEVTVGEAVGIVGPNGAGKTTLLDLLTGTTRCDAGRVRLNDEDVTRLPPPLRARKGLGRTFQVPRPLGDLTVFENALVGAMRAAGLHGRAAYAAAFEALENTGMARQANTKAGSLRLLDRKRLELARALAMRPRVLLLDEIAGGLSDPETEVLIETIRAVNAGGTTIIWVEHVMRVLTAVATRLVCLADGRVIADGSPAQVLASAEVRAAFLGGGVL
jgi:branched-chain amino acid transport system ATP-binding protein